MDEIGGCLVLWRRVRRDEHDRDRLRVVELGLGDRGDVSLLPERLDALVHALRRLRVAVDVDDDRDRAVEPWPEALGEQVVGPSRRLVGRLRPLIGRAQPYEGGAPGEEQADREEDPEDGLRVSGHEPAPARDQRLLSRCLGVVDRLQERHLQAVDLVPELGQHGDQQRVRDEHRRENAERAADAELRDEVEAEEREPRDGDRNGDAGEEHGAPCRTPASAAASRGERPSWRYCRKRVTMNSE